MKKDVSAKQKAMNLLSYRDHTEQELRKKLLHSGCSAEETEEAVRLMKEYAYVDDGRYAVRYVELNQERKSKNRIIQELRARGIDQDAIGQAVEFCYLESDDAVPNEEVAIKKATDKKLRQFENALTPNNKEKVAAYLYRQGYPKELIDRHLADKLLTNNQTNT